MDLAAPLSVVTPTVDGDVLVVLAHLTEPFTGRQIHQLVGQHSERGVRNTLNRLADTGLVSRQREGAADLFCLNRQHLGAPHVIALANLREEFHTRLVDQLRSWEAEVRAARVETVEDLVLISVETPHAHQPRMTGLARDLEAAVAQWLGNPSQVVPVGEDLLSAERVPGVRVLRVT